MTDKNQYQAFLRAKIKGAIAEARAASTLTHQGVKGLVLEILISRLFRPLLPNDIGIGTGQIIEQYKNQLSGQIDIVLYDRSILPPALYDDTTGLFPIEAVLYTIEVKTTLTMADIRASHDSAAKISTFGYSPGLLGDDGEPEHHSIDKVRYVVFALNSDLSGNGLTEPERYEKVLKQKKEEHRHIRAICVAGRGYWWDNQEAWISCSTDDEFDEILAFIGGVTNTYRRVARSRNYPLLGHYIIPEGEVQYGPPTGGIVLVDVTCEKCGQVAKLRPYVPNPNMIVEGRLKRRDPCPKCGGEMFSAPGPYVFKDGKLTKAD